MTLKKWKSVLDSMRKGTIMITKDAIKNKTAPFMWRTSAINQKENTVFEQSFTSSKKLPFKQDYTSFNEHISKASKHVNVISFPNLSGDTILIVPVPKKNKNFATVMDFARNADEKQQADFWKCVAKEARKSLKHHNKIWISTHGMGVPYLHVRICNKPKYYGESRLK